MPDTPIVSYLAHSLSAFYGIVGAITLCMSLETRRLRSFAALWGGLVTAAGEALLGIDMCSEKPLGWTLGERPPTMAVGLLVLVLQRNITPNEHGTPDQ